LNIKRSTNRAGRRLLDGEQISQARKPFSSAR
jgi:hypothetical protein